jgi:hypothetical protein
LRHGPCGSGGLCGEEGVRADHRVGVERWDGWRGASEGQGGRGGGHELLL